MCVGAINGARLRTRIGVPRIGTGLADYFDYGNQLHDSGSILMNVERGECLMTQELILGVLLVGIIGLVWALTFAILGEDQRAHDRKQDKTVASPVESRRAS